MHAAPRATTDTGEHVPPQATPDADEHPAPEPPPTQAPPTDRSRPSRMMSGDEEGP
ncbi:hypothetical protein [Streptomyces sp. 2A115]|uniref:hypothetical protein n=1 Tax=Streptomyces sp. 2A115 TaxID=3457439 RepID=UPI003FD61AB0